LVKAREAPKLIIRLAGLAQCRWSRLTSNVRRRKQPLMRPTMSSTPSLHLLCGKAGAGKTTLATALAVEYKALLIAEDLWLVRLYGPMKSFDEYRTYSQRARTVVGPLVGDLLRLGQNVVLDYPANTKASRLWLRSLSESAGARHLLHYVATPDEICLERIAQRNIERPEGSYHLTREDFNHVSSFFETPEGDEGFNMEVHAAADHRRPSGPGTLLSSSREPNSDA
jgi:predicted kinase